MWRNGIAIASMGLVTLVAWIVIRHLVNRRQRIRGSEPQEILSIDIAALPLKSPADRGVVLDIYGVPMIITVLVLAPAGRGLSLPTKTGMAQFVDSLVPDLIADYEFRVGFPKQLVVPAIQCSLFKKLSVPDDKKYD